MKFTHEALEHSIEVPAVKIVCPSCRGKGVCVRQDIDDSRLIDLMYEDGDCEGIESYRNGAYDEICPQCHGQNVVDEIDWAYLETNYPTAYKAIQEWDDDMREHHAESAAEAACGA